MYRIDDAQNIFLTRSDTCSLKLSVVDDNDTPYDYSNDLVQLTIKTNTYTPITVIQKNIVGDTFKIDPDDTKSLSYGKYLYDVQIITNSNDVYTVIGPCIFVLTDEVNFNVAR